jgi:hypothetical protein
MVFSTAMSDTEITIQRNTRGQFLTGHKQVSPGRPVGSRNRLTEDFLRDLSEAWKKHGPEALAQCAQNSPDVFVRVVSSLMPKQAEINVDVDIHAEVVALLDTLRQTNNGRINRGLEKMARRLLADTGVIIDAEPAD